MKIGFSHILLLCLMGISVYAGISSEAARIQATCESDNSRTFINGTEYLCLSARQIQRLQMQSRPGRSS